MRLAEPSEGATPRAVAQLPVPEPRRPANPLYVIARMLEASLHIIRDPDDEGDDE